MTKECIGDWHDPYRCICPANCAWCGYVTDHTTETCDERLHASRSDDPAQARGGYGSCAEKRLEARLARQDAPGVDDQHLVPAHVVVQLIRQRMKDTVRGMEGQ